MTLLQGMIDLNGRITIPGGAHHQFAPGDTIVTTDPGGAQQIFDVIKVPRQAPLRYNESIVLPNSWFADTLQLRGLGMILDNMPDTTGDYYGDAPLSTHEVEPAAPAPAPAPALEPTNVKGNPMSIAKKTIAQSLKDSTAAAGRQMMLATKQRAAAEASGALLNIGVGQLPEDWQLLLQSNPVAMSLLQMALPLALNTVLETSGVNIPGQKHLTAFAQLAIEGSSTQAANTLVSVVMPKLEMLAQLSAAAGYAKLLESDVGEPDGIEPNDVMKDGPTIDVKAERVS